MKELLTSVLTNIILVMVLGVLISIGAYLTKKEK